MKAQISLITIVSGDVPKMTRFYNEVLGFTIKHESENYVEFESEGVRFAICSRLIMADATSGHHSFHEEPKGQTFELAFPCESPDDVKKVYEELIAKGAAAVKEPAMMPWGHTTAFFADPDGNIHELFAG